MKLKSSKLRRTNNASVTVYMPYFHGNGRKRQIFTGTPCTFLVLEPISALTSCWDNVIKVASTATYKFLYVYKTDNTADCIYFKDVIIRGVARLFTIGW